jgi:predicted dehydrogenase
MKIAMVGCGGISQRHLITISDAGDELVAAVDPNLEHAQRAADQYGGQTFVGVEEMLVVLKPEAAVIASPPNVHLANASVLLRAGVPVLLEKPIAHSLADAEALVAVEAEAGVPAFVAYCHRYNPAVQFVREAYREGRLGHVNFWLNQFTGWMPQFMSAWRTDPAVAGSGVIGDNGSHAVDIFQFIFGPLREVYATLHYPRAGRADGEATIFGVSESGVPAHVMVGFLDTKGAAFFEAVGTEWSLTYDYGTSGATILAQKPGEAAEALPLAGDSGIRFAAQFAAFKAAVGGEKTDLCTFAEARQVQEVIERCVREGTIT